MRCDRIAFVYVVNPDDFRPSNFQQRQVGAHQWRFICQSLASLDNQLKQHGHQLIVLEGNPVTCIGEFIRANNIKTVGSACQIGWYEQQRWAALEQALPQVDFQAGWNGTLFEPQQLNLTEKTLSTFSKFRKQVESKHLEPLAPCKLLLDALPPATTADAGNDFDFVTLCKRYYQIGSSTPEQLDFLGGEQAALSHINDYFSTEAPLSYKRTRNALDGWLDSTKFSPYLANGTVSARRIWAELKAFEANVGSNDSTYWIGFELLWREYFQWSAMLSGAKLYRFAGRAATAPLTSFFAERFVKWCQGTTPYPLVNACMKQLNATGFMSNRGRQIVASCLVNELSLDWRYGAAYFQQQLVDFDIASNWGNWQYIAGVGSDPRGGRHFNLDKQTQQYDPEQVFIDKWQGASSTAALDSVDAADWPSEAP